MDEDGGGAEEEEEEKEGEGEGDDRVSAGGWNEGASSGAVYHWYYASLKEEETSSSPKREGRERKGKSLRACVRSFVRLWCMIVRGCRVWRLVLRRKRLGRH